MDMFNVLDYVTVDETRTAEDKATAEKAAQAAKAQSVGQALLNGDLTDEALIAGQVVYEAEVNHFRTWYTFDPDVVYPAAIDWLETHQGALKGYAARSDFDLVSLALSGDLVAHFTLKARKLVSEVASVSRDAWELARRGRDEFSKAEDGDELKRRENALEAARLFFTEALHQVHVTANENPGIGVKILAGDKRWAL